MGPPCTTRIYKTTRDTRQLAISCLNSPIRVYHVDNDLKFGKKNYACMHSCIGCMHAKPLKSCRHMSANCCTLVLLATNGVAMVLSIITSVALFLSGNY